MTTYLSFSMELEGSLTSLLNAIFSSDEFEPVALGAVAPIGSGAQWLLAGAPLDDLAERFLTKLGVTDVAVIDSRDPKVGHYLHAFADQLRGGVAPSVSPIEPDSAPRLPKSVASKVA